MTDESSRKPGRRKRTLGPASGALPQLFASEELRSVPDTMRIPELPIANLVLLSNEDEEEDDDDYRRQHRRKRFRKGLVVTINGQRFHARGVDISRGGIAFQPVPPDAKKNDPVLIEIEEPPDRLLGRIVWFRPLDDGTDNLQIGVRFSRPLSQSLDDEED